MFAVETARHPLRVTATGLTLRQAREVQALSTLPLQGQGEQEQGRRHPASASVNGEPDSKPVWVDPEPGVLASS